MRFLTLAILSFAATASYALQGNGPQGIAPQISKSGSPQLLKQKTEFFANTLENLEQFNSFASLTEGIIKGSAVKFLIDNRTQPAEIYFIDSNFKEPNGKVPNYVQYHYNFTKVKLGNNLDTEQFNRHTYFTNDLKQKKFIAGTLQRYEMTTQQGIKSFFGIQFYPQDAIAEQTLIYTVDIVKKAIRIKNIDLNFISYGSQQTFNTVEEGFKKINVRPTTVEQIYAGIPYVSMHAGVTYGYLKFQNKNSNVEELTPEDIPVFEELPLDLSVVAGVITTVVQDAGAHVNLKSKERNTPNMVLRDAEKIQQLKIYDQKPVKLSVENDTYQITLVSDEEVRKFHAQKLEGKTWYSVKSGTEMDVLLFDEMAQKFLPLDLTDKADSYGGKAAKLGMLAHQRMVGIGSVLQKKYNYRMTPTGMGIPVQFYFKFLEANPILKNRLEKMINQEMSLNGEIPPTALQRAQNVKEIQNLFYSAVVPSEMVEIVRIKSQELKSSHLQFFPKSPLKKIKIRSSANAEDIPKFDGAGLHSSYSANIDQLGRADEVCRVEVSQDGVATKEEMVPETILCGIKGVYASLWNKRAIEERSFAHIDQRTAAMGIAINTAYDFRKKTEGIKEIANAVVVTRIINSKGIYGYRLSINTDDNLVTNPTPGTQPEISLATFMGLDEAPQFSLIQHAKPVAGAPALTEKMLDQKFYLNLLEISRQVEYQYCKNVPEYYTLDGGDCDWVVSDVDKKSSLDMEFKIYSNGEIWVKQVREFSGQ